MVPRLDPGAFEMLEYEVEQLTQEPSGTGFDIPEWLEALAEEVDRVRGRNEDEEDVLPVDDVIPQAIGTEWGLDVFGMDLNHTGGNHMSDGLGMSASTELVYNENTDSTPAEIDGVMLDYLGNDYTVLDYIQPSGIHHIDCWAKYLGPATVMVKDVPANDPTYDELYARAVTLSPLSPKSST